MKGLINIFPLSTEKAYQQVGRNVYVFKAPVQANRHEIKEAVEKQFKVSVVKVKTLVQFGKQIKAQRGRHNRPAITSHQDFKKAYVTLKSGDSIKVFDEAVKSEETKKTSTKEKK